MKINQSNFGLNDDVGFQMAPMIDIVFLLIIFFMVAAKINQSQRVKLELPLASDSIVPKEASGRINVSIDEVGHIFAGSSQVDEAGLAQFLEKNKKTDPNLRVFLRADRRSRHKEVRKAMKVIADAGITDIIFATFQSDK